MGVTPVAPAKTNVPSPPTLFLDSTILADVYENIFQELNDLVQARSNLVHEDRYEKLTSLEAPSSEVVQQKMTSSEVLKIIRS